MLKLDFDQAKDFIKKKLEFDYNKLSKYGKNKYKDNNKTLL